MNGRDLYVIQMAVTGDIKVGRSKHVEKRLKELQTGSPHKLKLILHLPEEGWREKSLHQRMKRKSLRHNGEWFQVSALAELPDEIYGLLDLETQDWWVKAR